MEGPISFWGYKEQESNLILPEHDDNDDDKKISEQTANFALYTSNRLVFYNRGGKCLLHETDRVLMQNRHLSSLES